MKKYIYLLAILLLPIFKSSGQFASTKENLSLNEIQVGGLPDDNNLDITWPLDRQIVQRDGSDDATISIAGQFFDTSQDINDYLTAQYSIVKVSNADGTSSPSTVKGWTSITTINNIPGIGLKTFLVQETILNKGWYILKIRLNKTANNNEIRALKEVKFGVGDVYIIAGQSNASGFEWDQSSLFSDNNLQPFSNNYNQNDAVSFVNGNEIAPVINQVRENPVTYPIMGMPIQKGKFDKLIRGDFNNVQQMYPNGRHSWCWAPLGSKIADPSFGNTPVMFLNTAVPNSEIQYWTPAYEPYQRFRSVLQMYGNILGTRGIIWHQGEAEAINQSRNAATADFSYYRASVENLIENSRNSFFRNQTNSSLNWFVSSASYYSYPFDINTQYGYDYCVYNNTPPSGSLPFSPVSMLGQNVCVDGTSTSPYNPSLVNTQFGTSNGTPLAGVKQGVFTDDIGGDANRNSYRKIHFTGQSLNEVAGRWYGKLYPNNSAVSSPNSGNQLSPITVQFTGSVSGVGSYTLTAPSGGSNRKYFWTTDNEGIYNPLSRSQTLSVNNINSNNDKIYICYYSDDNDADEATNGWDLRLSATQPFKVRASTKYVRSPSSSYSFNANSGSFGLESLNTNWSVVNVPSWVTITGGASGGSGNHNVSFNMTTNSSSSNRTAIVRVQESGGPLYQDISIIQNPSSGGNLPLSSLTPTSSYTGAGTINYNGLNISGNTMKVNGQTYTQGIGTHSQSGIVYNLPSGYTHFNGLVGRDDGSDNCGCGSTQMNFQIKLNGNVVWSSMSHGENSNAESFSVPLNGATQLELFTDYQDGSYYGDWGDWINPVLSGSGGGPTGSPAPPHTISANPATVAPNATSQLYATCAQGVVTWSNNATGSPISVNPSVTTTYNVNCVDGSAYSTSEAVTVNVTGGGGSCSVVTDNLVMGTWNVTGDQLVSRYLNGSYWLVQKVNVNGSQYDEFVVRASQMLTRGDVTLTNSSYSGLVSCYSWQYSNYGGLEVPNATSSPAFPVPSGFYGYTASDGTQYYSNYVAPSNSCSVLSNNLVMGTWTVTGHQLVSRYFHSDYWLVQKVNVNGSQYDEFVVRGSAMLTRTDVTLNNSSYYNLPDCYGWVYSNYGNLEGPSAATFPTPSGYYRFVSNGTTYFTNYANGYNEGARMGVLEEREVSEELTPFLSFTPNPNTGKFEVILFLNEASEVQVSLTNAVGSQVLNKELNGIKGYNKMEIELKNKTPGVYIIKAVSDGKQDSKKVVIN